MRELIDIVFWGLLAFMVADYALGRAKVKDVLRAVVAAVFAVLFVVVGRALL